MTPYCLKCRILKLDQHFDISFEFTFQNLGVKEVMFFMTRNNVTMQCHSCRKEFLTNKINDLYHIRPDSPNVAVLLGYV